MRRIWDKLSRSPAFAGFIEWLGILAEAAVFAGLAAFALYWFTWYIVLGGPPKI